MKIKITKSYTFDDLLLIPRYSDISSRSNVDISTTIKSIKYNTPLIPANMKTIISKDMINAFYNNKSLSIMHRFSPIEEQLELINSLNIDKNYLSVSIGTKSEDYTNIQKFLDVGISIFTIDIAHAHSKQTADIINFLKKYDTTIIAGNVASVDGARFLWQNGADVIKVGIGGGRYLHNKN